MLQEAENDYDTRLLDYESERKPRKVDSLPEVLREPWKKVVASIEKELQNLRLAQIFDPHIAGIRDALERLVGDKSLLRGKESPEIEAIHENIEGILECVQHEKLVTTEKKVQPIENPFRDDGEGFVALKDAREDSEKEAAGANKTDESEIEEEAVKVVRDCISDLKNFRELMEYTVSVVEAEKSCCGELILCSWLSSLSGVFNENIIPYSDEIDANYNMAVFHDVWCQLKDICKYAAVCKQSSQSEVQSLRELPELTRCTLLGSGGFGNVHKVKRWNGKSVAMKRLNSVAFASTYEAYTSMVESHKLLKSFATEKIAWEALSGGKHIVTLYGFGPALVKEPYQEEITLGFVCELASRSLTHSLHFKPKLEQTPTNVEAIASGIINGLQYMHKNLFVHGDLNPNNVLLFEKRSGGAPVAKLADFGTSKKIRENWNSLEGVVLPEHTQGTEGFMGTEVSHSCLTTASDVYSFGATLFALIDFKVDGAKIKFPTAKYCFEQKIGIKNCNVCSELVNLIQQTQNPDVRERPSLEQCRKVLKYSPIYVNNDELIKVERATEFPI